MKKDNLYQKRFCLGRLYSKRYRLRKKFFKKLLLEWGFNKKANVADVVWKHMVGKMMIDNDWLFDEFKPVFHSVDDNDLMINFASDFHKDDTNHLFMPRYMGVVNVEGLIDYSILTDFI